jgi:hypothetical protein
MMNARARSYAIYNLKTGRLVARISPDGVVHGEGEPEAVATLKALMQRDIVIREHQINFDPQDADEEYDPYPEESMCYFGVVTLRPSDPSYLKAFLRRLPYISYYEARPSET